MTVKLHQVIFPVSDFTRAVDFYGYLLEMGGRRVSAGRHDFDCGGLILTCVDPQIEGEEFAVSTPYHLRFSVEDPESMFQRAKKAGCTFQDEGIITTPWGDRSFSAQDPFGNRLGFAAAAGLQRSLTECSAIGPYDHLRIGKKLSLRGANWNDDEQVFASVAKVFQDSLWLKFLEALPESPFKEGDAVRIQYWDVDSAFYSDAKVSEVSENAYLAITVPEETTQLQRRTSPRVRTQAPFTLSVIDAPQTSLSPGQSISSQTFDMSIGGMRFETNLPLEKGNQIQLMLSLPDFEEIQVDPDVVTAEPVERGGETVNSVGATFVALDLEDQIKILGFLVDSSDDARATTEGQQGSEVQEIPAASQEVGSEVVSARPPAPDPVEAPSPLTLKRSKEENSATIIEEQSDEVSVQQDASEAVADVQEDSRNDEVTDSQPEPHFQVVGSR